jgi:hypothetical protein
MGTPAPVVQDVGHLLHHSCTSIACAVLRKQQLPQLLCQRSER